MILQSLNVFLSRLAGILLLEPGCAAFIRIAQRSQRSSMLSRCLLTYLSVASARTQTLRLQRPTRQVPPGTAVEMFCDASPSAFLTVAQFFVPLVRIPGHNPRRRGSLNQRHWRIQLTKERWARPDSNRRPPPCEGSFGASTQRHNQLDHEPSHVSNVSLSTLELSFDFEDLREYVEGRKLGLSEHSVDWIERCARSIQSTECSDSPSFLPST